MATARTASFQIPAHLEVPVDGSISSAVSVFVLTLAAFDPAMPLSQDELVSAYH